MTQLITHYKHRGTGFWKQRQSEQIGSKLAKSTAVSIARQFCHTRTSGEIHPERSNTVAETGRMAAQRNQNVDHHQCDAPYSRKPGDEPMDFVVPALQLDAIIDNGTTNRYIWFQTSIFPPKVDMPMERKAKP
jgi:hypothetical protein